jgi:phage terminase large subunit
MTSGYLRDARAAGCPDGQYARFCAGAYTAQAKQLLFHAACRLCDRPDGPTQIGFGGARGGAKSHAMLAQIALDDCQRQPGLKCLLLRKVGRAAREGFEDLRLRVLATVPHEYRRSEGILSFPNGSRIVLGHFKDESDVDAYLGLEYDVIGVEEATTLTFSKYRTIRTCCRTSKPAWRPRIYTTTNPGGVGHAWYKQTFIAPWKAGAETDTRFIPSTVDDNSFVNREYTATLDELTGWQRRAWRLGDWDIAAGQFFTTYRSDVHIIEPFTIPPNWTVWLAMDYGFTHYNEILLFTQDADGRLYVVAEHAEQRWLVPRHAFALAQMLARHSIEPSRLACFVAGRDVFAARPTDQGTIADQWAVQGWQLDPAHDDRINGAAEVLRRLGDVEATGGSPGPLYSAAQSAAAPAEWAGILPSLRIFRTCARLIDCLPALEHDPHRPEDVLKWDTDDDGNGGDDPYDALRYGLLACPGSPTANHGAANCRGDPLWSPRAESRSPS